MMMLIAYSLEKQGWCVFNMFAHARTELLAGPYATHVEAVEAVETMAFRIKQGWNA